MGVFRSYHWSKVTYSQTAKGKLKNNVKRDVSASLTSQQLPFHPHTVLIRVATVFIGKMSSMYVQMYTDVCVGDLSIMNSCCKSGDKV